MDSKKDKIDEIVHRLRIEQKRLDVLRHDFKESRKKEEKEELDVLELATFIKLMSILDYLQKDISNAYSYYAQEKAMLDFGRNMKFEKEMKKFLKKVLSNLKGQGCIKTCALALYIFRIQYSFHIGKEVDIYV